MKPRQKSLISGIVVMLFLLVASAYGENFTRGSDVATKFGVHEVVLTGNGSVANPFDTVVTVRFTPPSGEKTSTSVWAFYDGENTWRARVYLNETGPWNWSSSCATDAGLNGKSGRFQCEDSLLRGRLLIHPNNPRQWMTENGKWFLNLNDTSYFHVSRLEVVTNVPDRIETGAPWTGTDAVLRLKHETGN